MIYRLVVLMGTVEVLAEVVLKIGRLRVVCFAIQTLFTVYLQEQSYERPRSKRGSSPPVPAMRTKMQSEGGRFLNVSNCMIKLKGFM